jgi:hypothetical protein
MPFVMPEEKARELPPAGAHTAICIKVIDLGTQDGKFGAKHQLYIGWELPDERMSDGKPFGAGKFYNYSSNQKATLRQDVQGWLGRTLTTNDFGRFDLGSLLGMTCTLAIMHSEKDGNPRANITSVLRPGKGVLPRLPPSNPATVLSLSDRPFDFGSYEGLPGWLKELIAKSPEYKRAANGGTSPQDRVAAILAESPKEATVNHEDRDNLDDEIPF